jgi:hypothetical protein
LDVLLLSQVGNGFFDEVRVGKVHRLVGREGGGGNELPLLSGKRVSDSVSQVKLKVYPRGCGATDYVPIDIDGPGGLSPRVRSHPCYNMSQTNRGKCKSWSLTEFYESF